MDDTWRFSESRSELYKAFSQLNLDYVSKDATVDFVGKKGRVSFMYRDLDSILPVVRSACKAVELGVIQFPTFDPKTQSCIVTTHVGHSSGEWLETVLGLPLTEMDPKIYAGLTTYLRRYQIESIFGICSEEDRDAAGLPAPPYSGSPPDKAWLAGILDGLPFDLDKDQMKRIHLKMQSEGTLMDITRVTEISEKEASPNE